MHRSRSLAKKFCNKILHRYRPCDVFINHQGTDTKRTISGLLHNHLVLLGLNPFMDKKNMKPGDRLFEKINDALQHCKVGVAVFSPRYCESYFCLYELSRMMENRKRVIPIFCDVKPSQLQVKDDGSGVKELQRFGWALEEAKCIVGVTYDTMNGNLSKFLKTAADAVVKNLLEVDGIEEEEYIRIMKLIHKGNSNAHLFNIKGIYN